MVSNKSPLGIIFLTVFISMVGFGIVIPVLPKLVESFVDNDTASAARIFGLFGTAWALMQFLFSPILGALSDRFGRRPVVLLSNLGLALDYVLMALAPSLTWLFVGRVISGITSASISTSFAYIADVTPPEKRAAVFGKVGAAFGAMLQDRVPLTVIFFGDAATETGVFHESVNFAAVHRLPVLFVHAAWDTICETMHSGLAGPMRAACPQLREIYIDGGHELMLERPLEVNAALGGWLKTPAG